MHSDAKPTDIRSRLLELIHHFEHVLPSQGPIRDFVHHNTLHGYQHLPFDQALTASRELTGAQGYLPEARFRTYFEQGRITRDDLSYALDSMESVRAGEALPVSLPDNKLLRRNVLLPSLIHGFGRLSRGQLKWQVEELHALEQFQASSDEAARTRLLASAGTSSEKSALNDL